MKIYFALFLCLVLVCCNKQRLDKTPSAKTILPVKDTAEVKIIVNNEELKYTKSQLNELSEYFNEDNLVNPDIVYAKWENCGFENFKENFSSEAGKDDFYMLYTYFLQKNDTARVQSTFRNRILKIFRAINDLNGNLQYGGTYFGHQNLRINGYAEYACCSINNDWYAKKYNIDKQKNMFLESLRRHVHDEEQFDYNTLGEEKIKRREKLMEIIDSIGNHIETFYDLRKAQEFQYTYYNWL